LSYRLRPALLCATALLGFAVPASASPLVTASVDDTVVVAVKGEKSPFLANAKDMGELADTQKLPHVMLVLKRPALQQAAFDSLVHDQQVRTSPSYHKWLTAAQLRGYGPDQADVEKVVAWLQSHALTVNSVSPSGMSIDFAGAPSAVGATFHTSLHQVQMPNGEAHIANITDLAIPAALAPVVRGATLSNFFPKSNMIKAGNSALAKHGIKQGGARDDVGGYEAVAPQDFNTIYNVNPLLTGLGASGKLSGAGVTVAVIEQTTILPADWKTFRKAFGLSTYAGTLKLTHPHCTTPGATPDEGEAALDAEWISVAAPDATVIEASCESTPLTFGVETSLQGVVEHATAVQVLSISYGGPEQQSSSSFLAGWSNLLEEAASEGISSFISSGDSGSSYDRGLPAVDGLAVNGLSTNAYNTTVGGTDFLDTSLGTNAKYWATTNGASFSSALAYIPETPWNNSCAGAVITKYGKYASSIASCNDPNNPYNFQDGVGGSGGESTIYAKPDFQNNGIPGMPADGMRDQPDVSLFASNGFWQHFLVFCMSDVNEGGATCNYKNVTDTFDNAAGGTSFAAPAFAGIAALIVQKNGSVGNTATRLYDLAKTQFTTSPLKTTCVSAHSRSASNACVFYNVTVGNIAEPCYATSGDCFTTNKAVEGLGILRNDNAPKVDAYPATAGYSMAAGLGSLNVTNLVAAY
jgi:subtilase family serine protease